MVRSIPQNTSIRMRDANKYCPRNTRWEEEEEEEEEEEDEEDEEEESFTQYT